MMKIISIISLYIITGVSGSVEQISRDQLDRVTDIPKLVIATSVLAVEHDIFDDTLRQDILATINIPGATGTPLTGINNIQINGNKNAAKEFIKVVESIIALYQDNYPQFSMMLYLEDKLFDLLIANKIVKNKEKAIKTLGEVEPNTDNHKITWPSMEGIGKGFGKIGQKFRNFFHKLSTVASHPIMSLLLAIYKKMNKDVRIYLDNYAVNINDLVIATSQKAVDNNIFDQDTQQRILATAKVAGVTGEHLDYKGSKKIQINGNQTAASQFIQELQSIIFYYHQDVKTDPIMKVILEGGLLDLLLANDIISMAYFIAVKDLCDLSVE